MMTEFSIGGCKQQVMMCKSIQNPHNVENAKSSAVIHKKWSSPLKFWSSQKKTSLKKQQETSEKV